MMTLKEDGPAALAASWDGAELFRYVFCPDSPQRESPRPYFHPVRTLGGDLVTVFRPHDHVWHKGIALSLPYVGPDNFWGGPTFWRGRYVQVPNDGAMRHDGFDRAEVAGPDAAGGPAGGRAGSSGAGGAGGAAADGGVIRFDERLTWVSEAGQAKVAERRRVAAAAWPGEQAWGIAFETTLANVSGASLVLASPTAAGRPDAGYGGLFWRGPRSFAGGTVLLPDARGGDELMGRRAPWLAFTGRQDGSCRDSTLVFADSPANFSFPSPWFVRATPFACACPAPFFSTPRALPAGQSLTLRYGITIADGARDAPACAALAARPASLLPAAE